MTGFGRGWGSVLMIQQFEALNSFLAQLHVYYLPLPCELPFPENFAAQRYVIDLVLELVTLVTYLFICRIYTCIVFCLFIASKPGYKTDHINFYYLSTECM